MEANRFDNWTRNRALRLSRRDALRLVGAGGAAAALPLAAPDTLAQGSCSLTIHGQTDGGPSAPVAIDGTLQFTLGSDGTFTQASFTSSTGGAQSVSGRATGRAIDFEVTLSGNQILSFSGAGDQPLTSCQGTVAGVVSGPQPGDIGGWQTTGAASGSASTSSSGSSQSTSGSSSSSSSGSTSGSGSGGGNGGSCLELQSQCNDNSECCSGFCTDNECRSCGGMMCDNRCIDPNLDPENCGGCGNFCDSGVCNGGACNGADGGGGGGCLELHSQCNASVECCSGWCTDNECRSCSDTICGDDCIVLSDNLAHCGACFNACNTDTQSCINGVCT